MGLHLEGKLEVEGSHLLAVPEVAKLDRIKSHLAGDSLAKLELRRIILLLAALVEHPKVQ